MATSGRKSSSERYVLVRICRGFPWTLSHILRDSTHASTDLEWGVSFRPWQLFGLGNAESAWFVTFNSTTDCSTVMIFGCETIVTSIVSHVFRTVHVFDFRLFIQETLNKQRPEARSSCSDKNSYFWQTLYIFSRPFRESEGSLLMLFRLSAFSWVRGIVSFCVCKNC
jgi:hypothetical protein